MREWEQATWAAGTTESSVIARVGELVASRARRLARAGDRVLVLAGKGNNGEDARHALKHLPSDWQVHAQNVSGSDYDFTAALAQLEQRPALIIDGLFGIGLNRPLDSKWTALIQRINELQTVVLSVDVPSGLNAATGEPEGAAIQATVTLTLGAPKRGLLQPSAWPYVGRLEVSADIGLIPCPLASDLNWTLPEDFAGYPPVRGIAANKGDFGRLAIIAGSLGFHGAAVLTARGAQRAQPGLITLYTQESIYQPVASQLQAVMVGIWRPNLPLPGNFNALMAGPGLAAENLPDVLRATIRHLWQTSPVPMIVDASALAWLPAGPLAKPEFIRVITPHPGEAARLLQIPTREVQANRVVALRELSQRLGHCWVVLKGSETLTGRATGNIVVNSSGNPQLAQGGSGDVLAGYLAGLLAQPPLQSDPLKTLALGVWQHGAAADRLSETKRNWVVEDLAAEIGA